MEIIQLNDRESSTFTYFIVAPQGCSNDTLKHPCFLQPAINIIHQGTLVVFITTKSRSCRYLFCANFQQHFRLAMYLVLNKSETV